MSQLELHRDLPNASADQKRDALVNVLQAAGMDAHPVYKHSGATPRALQTADEDTKSRAIVFSSPRDDTPWGYKLAMRFGFNSQGRGYYSMVDLVDADYAQNIREGRTETRSPRPRKAFPIPEIHRAQLMDFFREYYDSSGLSPLLFNAFNFREKAPTRVQIQLARDTVQLADRQVAGFYMEPVTQIQFGRDLRRLKYSFSNHGNTGWLVQV